MFVNDIIHTMKKVFLWLLLFPLVSHADTIKWQEQKNALEIGNKVEVLKDPGGKLSFDDVRSAQLQNKFTPSKTINLILGYTESVFWVKFSFENDTPDKLVLEIAQAGLPVCDFYEQLSDDSTIVYRAGSNTPIHQKVIMSSFQVFPLSQGKNDYYIRLTTNSGPIPLRIYTQNAYDEKSLSQKFIYGIYLGLMFFVFLSNLFFFYSLRNYFYLANALNVVIFICYSMVVVDGFVTYFFPKIDMRFWYTLIPPLGVTIQLIYSVLYLEVKKYSPTVYRFTLGVVAIYIIWFFLKFFLPFSIVQPINTLQALLSFFIVGFISMQVGRKGNIFGYYFALTYFVYFLLVLAEAMYINTGRPTYIFGFSYSGYATVVEALALSFLLTKRFEWEKEEIERIEKEIQKQLFEKTVENERIVKEQNVFLEQKVEERTHELRLAMQKSEDLLLNILPEAIANELKEYGKTETKTYGLVTVLFTDFKDFTDISSKMSPELLVQEIDTCFSAFDSIITNHGIEKIKTVGDAYIAVAGLPVPTYHHAENAVEAAIEIRDFILKRREEKKLMGETPFEIRIGLHSGPLVAGIVGTKKFAFDIWGDAVNVAARMEQNGEPGKINISDKTYELVRDKFACKHRGKIPAKNKGDIDMYFVERSS
jgi:class 3 adenylate cyclase